MKFESNPGLGTLRIAQWRLSIRHLITRRMAASTLAVPVLACLFWPLQSYGQMWTELNSVGSFPVAGAGPLSAGYNPNGSRFIIFGGGQPRTNDVWVLSHAGGVGGTPTWTMLAPLGPAPAVRANSALAYDAGSNRLIVFGGMNGNLDTFVAYNDVWVLTNANGLENIPSQWIELYPGGTAPAPRAVLSAIFDPSSNRMTVFGGCTKGTFGCDVPQNDTWVLTNATGLGGTPAWIKLNPIGGPPGPRNSHTASFDPDTNRMIVFGGVGGNTGAIYRDVWVLEGANGLGSMPHWVQLTPGGTSTPGTRYNHAAGYNPAANQLFIFGGVSSGAEKNDTWVLAHADGLGGSPSWRELFPTGGPPSTREAQSSAFDPYLNRMIVFGGDSLTDTWVLTNP
jgi:hypothetical protein